MSTLTSDHATHNSTQKQQQQLNNSTQYLTVEGEGELQFYVLEPRVRYSPIRAIELAVNFRLFYQTDC